MPTIALGRCLNDPNLFAHHFKGKSWAAWKVFLAALFGKPRMRRGWRCTVSEPGGQHGPQRHSPRRDDGRPARRQVADIGADRRLFACFRSYDQFLAPGEKQRQFVRVSVISVTASDQSSALKIGLKGRLCEAARSSQPGPDSGLVPICTKSGFSRRTAEVSTTCLRT